MVLAFFFGYSLTLQPLLTEMTQTHVSVLQQIFNEHYPELQAKLGADREEQLAWARSIQAPPWRSSAIQCPVVGNQPPGVAGNPR